MPDLVAETDDFNLPLGHPTPKLDHLIRWYGDEKYRYGYKPYVVSFSAVNGMKMSFQFVNGDTGVVFGDTHSVDLTDLSAGYPFSPSTVPTPQEMADNKRVGFLFLNRDKLSGTALANADASDPDTGKWPKTSEEDAKKIAALQDAVRKLLKAVVNHT